MCPLIIGPFSVFFLKICVCMLMYVCIFMHVCALTCECIYVCMCMFMYMHACVCMYSFMYVYVCACLCECGYVCVCMFMYMLVWAHVPLLPLGSDSSVFTDREDGCLPAVPQYLVQDADSTDRSGCLWWRRDQYQWVVFCEPWARAGTHHPLSVAWWLSPFQDGLSGSQFDLSQGPFLSSCLFSSMIQSRTS